AVLRTRFVDGKNTRVDCRMRVRGWMSLVRWAGRRFDTARKRSGTVDFGEGMRLICSEIDSDVSKFLQSNRDPSASWPGVQKPHARRNRTTPVGMTDAWSVFERMS